MFVDGSQYPCCLRLLLLRCPDQLLMKLLSISKAVCLFATVWCTQVVGSETISEQAHSAAFSLMVAKADSPEVQQALIVLAPFEDREKRSSYAIKKRGGERQKFEQRTYAEFGISVELLDGRFELANLLNRRMNVKGKKLVYSERESLEIIQAVADLVDERYAEAGHDISKFGDPYLTIKLVLGAQATIDNGGLNYFFENDWPGNPPYSYFVDAYERIACSASAKSIAHAAKSFGVERPEADYLFRRKFMAENYDEKRRTVKGWPDPVFGSQSVWHHLALWIYTHPELRKVVEGQVRAGEVD